MEKVVQCPRCGGTGEVTHETLAGFRAAGIEASVQKVGSCKFCDGEGTVAAIVATLASPYDWTQCPDDAGIDDEAAFLAAVTRLETAPPSTQRSTAWGSLAWLGVDAGVSAEVMMTTWLRARPFVDSADLGRFLAALYALGSISGEEALAFACDDEHPRAKGAPTLSTWTASYLGRFVNGRLSGDRAVELLVAVLAARTDLPNPWMEAYTVSRAAQTLAHADGALFMEHRHKLIDVVMDMEARVKLGSNWRYPRRRVLQGYCEWAMPHLSPAQWSTLADEIMDLTASWDESGYGKQDGQLLQFVTTQDASPERDAVFARIIERLENGPSAWDWSGHATALMNGLTGEHTSEEQVRRLFQATDSFGADDVWGDSIEYAVGMLLRHADRPWAERVFQELVSTHLTGIKAKTTRGEASMRALEGLANRPRTSWAFAAAEALITLCGECYREGEIAHGADSGIKGVLSLWRHPNFKRLFATWCDITVNEGQHGLCWVWKLATLSRGAFNDGYAELFPQLLDPILDTVYDFKAATRVSAVRDLREIPYALPPGALFETYTAKLWALVDSIPVTEGMRATAILELSLNVTGGAAFETDPVEVERLVEGVSRLGACPPNEAKLSCVHEILRLLDVRAQHAFAEHINTPVSVSMLFDLLVESAGLAEVENKYVKGPGLQTYAVGCLQALRTERPPLQPEQYTRYREQLEGLLATEVSCGAQGYRVDEGELPLISLRPRSEALQLLVDLLATTGDTTFRDTELTAHLAFIEAHSDREERLALFSALAASLGQAAEHDWADAWLDRLLELEVEQEADTSALRVAITLAYLARGDVDRADTSVRFISDIVRRDACLKSMANALATDEPLRAVNLVSRIAQPTARIDALEALGLSAELTLTAEVYGQLCGALVDTPNRLTAVVERCVARMPELVDVPPSVTGFEPDPEPDHTRDAAWRAAITAVAPDLLETIELKLSKGDV